MSRPKSVESGATSNTARKSRPIDAAGGIDFLVLRIVHALGRYYRSSLQPLP
jgi:hypothetical protein